MATNFSGIKEKLDLPSWQSTPVIYSGLHVIQPAVAGSTLSGDKRASQYGQSLIWYLNSNTTLYQYRTKGNGWNQLASPALAGTFGVGSCTVFAPSQGPRGTIAAGATTTSVVLSTALPASVGPNQLVRQRIRIIGNNAGGSGLIAERTIIANTSGTTPTITVDTAFGFTPGTGAAYEFLSGRLYMLGAGTTAAGIWKFYDVATNSFSGNLATTNLPATVGTSSTIVSLDEQHTPISGPSGTNPTGATINGETGGYFGTLTATAISATTLTGQATDGDSSVLANEYRNFQIRIVEDATTPTAVGQRRRITSHTAGASPVYTVPTWTVTPSATAKYMIENNNDILLWTGSTISTHRYDSVANAWDTTTYAVLPASNAPGATAFHPFGLRLTTAKTLRHSFIYRFRGSASSTLDVLDIAAGATGVWSANVLYDNQGGATFNASSASTYSAVNDSVMLCAVQLANIPPNMYYFDVQRNSLLAYAPCPLIAGPVVDGDRLAVDYYVDGTDKKAFFYFLPASQTYMLRTMFIN
jgi:hypothetical protein